MDSEVKVYTRENGEIQRVQVVRLDDWAKLDFLWLKENSRNSKKETGYSVKGEVTQGQTRALACFRDIYANYLVPACPWIFPQMVMFTLPEDLNVDELLSEMVCELDGITSGFFCSTKYGMVKEKLVAASILLERGVRIRSGKPTFSDSKAEHLWHELEDRGCVHIVCGKFPSTKIIPVANYAGYLSEHEADAAMKVNANFFIMDPFDCATIYDQVSTPFGLCVKDGVVSTPPLFGREALLVDMDGKVSIREMDVRELEVVIGGIHFCHGKNATIYSRPERAKTPAMDGTHLVIVGNRVVAVKERGPVEIPASGFVLCVEESSIVDVAPGDEVIYHGLENVQFGIQVGNSIIRDGEKTMEFISRFYNIYHLERVPFPPSLYPMDFKKARAARIALGADADGKPVLFWAEGKGKLGYEAGQDSTGASLIEMAEIASDLGLRQAVNLDGGGSAQMLVNGIRTLRISDRNKEDNSDAERLVPLGLVVK